MRCSMILLWSALSMPAPAASVPPPDYGAAGIPAPACADIAAATARPLGLPALLDLALCRDPLTAAAWAGVRAAAARAVQTASLYGPRLDASIGADGLFSRRSGGGFPAGTDSSATATAGLSLGWLLYDFGGREAVLAGADAARAVALAAFADQAQAILLETGTGYHDLLAAVASDVAARENLLFAENSLAAATARERAGVGIKSDRLQADAAAAAALLGVRQAEANLAIARGRLANALRLSPGAQLALAPPEPIEAVGAMAESADALMAAAADLRPDLAQARASLRQADAGLSSAEAARRPSISVSARPGATIGTVGQDVASAGAGITLSVPLFDSGGRTAAVAAARADADRAAQLLVASEQAARLDVWTRYQSLLAVSANLDTSRRQLASAEEAAALAQGRYRAGLATITELLNAQATLASARLQLVDAEFGVRNAELLLARAVGRIGDAVR